MSKTQSSMLDEIFTFVIMPFDSDFDDVYKLGIKHAIDCNVRAERLDEQMFEEGMLDRIFRQIEVADFIIADLSNRNPNFFYELGYDHAREKICILLTKEPTDIPFDLKHKRHIVYGDSISILKSELVKNIIWTKSEAKTRKEERIQIIPRKPTGDL